VTLEPGMKIAVRLIRGDVLQGVLEQPVIAEGLEVAERGAKVSVRSEQGQVRLLSFQSADGQRVEISTDPAAMGDGEVVRFRLASRTTITERRL
jgi:hypothetical protein